MTVVVVGGGLAGLVAGLELRRRGLEPLVLEADPEPGGKLHTRDEGGWLIERGPQTFLEEEGDALSRAIAAAGLGDEVVRPGAVARRRLVLSGGRLCELPRQLHRAIGVSGLFRAAVEPFVGARRDGEPESLAALGRRRFGESAARVLFDALATGIWAGDPERLEVASALPRLHRMEQERGSLVLALLRGGAKPRRAAAFRGGMGQLARGLATALGPAFRAGAPVESLARQGDGWTVVAAGEAHRARAVILALPPWDAAPLVSPVSPALAAELAAIPVAPVSVVALGWPAAAFERGPPRGFGFLVPHREERTSLGCIFVSSLFPSAAPEDKVLLRVLTGGRRRPEVAAWPDERLIASVTDELTALLHVRGAPELARVVRLPRAIPQYELGHLARVARIDALAAELPGLHLTGNGYRGVALGEVAADAERVASVS